MPCAERFGLKWLNFKRVCSLISMRNNKTKEAAPNTCKYSRPAFKSLSLSQKSGCVWLLEEIIHTAQYTKYQPMCYMLRMVWLQTEHKSHTCRAVVVRISNRVYGIYCSQALLSGCRYIGQVSVSIELKVMKIKCAHAVWCGFFALNGVSDFDFAWQRVAWRWHNGPRGGRDCDRVRFVATNIRTSQLARKSVPINWSLIRLPIALLRHSAVSNASYAINILNRRTESASNLKSIIWLFLSYQKFTFLAFHSMPIGIDTFPEHFCQLLHFDVNFTKYDRVSQMLPIRYSQLDCLLPTIRHINASISNGPIQIVELAAVICRLPKVYLKIESFSLDSSLIIPCSLTLIYSTGSSKRAKLAYASHSDVGQRWFS